MQKNCSIIFSYTSKAIHSKKKDEFAAKKREELESENEKKKSRIQSEINA